MMDVLRYQPQYAQLWTAFVRTSKQGVFLFERAYMDYHADRIADHSVIVCSRQQPIALLPAHCQGNQWISHNGLTFGGLITNYKLKLHELLQVIEAILHYGRENGLKSLVYKAVPHIYHAQPSEEDVYVLHLLGADLISRGLTHCVKISANAPSTSRRMGGVKAAQANGVTCGESNDWTTFWSMLILRLQTHYGTKPVHSLAEINLLRQRFADRVKLFSAELDGEMVAGIVVYEYDRVVRAQYISSNERGRAISAIDLIVYELLTNFYADQQFEWFDFGTSAQPEGNALHAGLTGQKEKFGGRPVVMDTYYVDLQRSPIERLGQHLR